MKSFNYFLHQFPASWNAPRLTRADRRVSQIRARITESGFIPKAEIAPVAEIEAEDPVINALENSRELIKDRLIKLSWEDMQALVAGILRAMGYKTKISLGGGDKGKDVIASPDGLGLEHLAYSLKSSIARSKWARPMFDNSLVDATLRTIAACS